MDKKIIKALLVYLAMHAVHALLDDEIDAEARKHGWTPQHVEAAKLVVSGAMLLV